MALSKRKSNKRKSNTELRSKGSIDVTAILNNVDPNDDTKIFAIDPFPQSRRQEYLNRGLAGQSEFNRQLEYQDLLRNLQGNILKGHDRDNLVLVFLQFNTQGPNGKKNQKRIKKRIAQFAHYCTSAKIQLEEWYLYHNYHIHGGSFGNLFLTAKGYAALGYDLLKINKDYDSKRLPEHKFDDKFIAGMQESKNELNDREPFDPNMLYSWDDQYLDMEKQIPRDIHAMILVADDSEDILGQKMRIILRDVLQTEDDEDLASIIAVERGQVIRREVNGIMQPVEHFGYVDGISNPIFLATDKEERVDKLGGQDKWNPWAPLSVVLTKDPLDSNDWGFGSYLVYRKLEQNVKHFVFQKEQMATLLFGVTEVSEIQARTAGALVMGRYENGTPLTLVTELGADLSYQVEVTNNFNYLRDPGDGTVGTLCPLQAHIRKANPRRDPDKVIKHMPRIVRRGITYGTRAEGLNETYDSLPVNGVGILFMSFQSKISAFEEIQSALNTSDPTCCDQIVGQRKSDDPPEDPLWPIPGPSTGKTESFQFHDFSHFVTLRGGEYFFAPSISFLKSLGKE